jgi:tetratricopeptide (TPR) repeat protein
LNEAAQPQGLQVEIMTSEESVYYQRGKDAYARGDFAEAEKCLIRVLQTRREYADIYAMLGAIYHGKGRFAEAIRLFAKALEINSSYTEAKVNLMVLLQDLGRYDRAKKILIDLQQGADALPQSPDPLSKNRLANLHAATGDMYMALDLYEAALKQFEQALELRPGFSDIRLKLARAYKAAGRLEVAEVHVRTCLNAKPDYSEARVFLGSLLLAQGRRTQALDAWQQVLALDPKHEDASKLMRLINGKPLPEDMAMDIDPDLARSAAELLKPAIPH